MVSPSSPEEGLVLNLGHGLPICLCVALPLCVYVHKSYRCYICMLKSKLWNSVFWPHVVFQAHPCSNMEFLAPFDGDVVCYLSPVPAIAIHPGCLPRSSRGRYSRGGAAESQRAQLPAGLACANLYSRACRVLRSTSEGSGPPHSHPSSLRLHFSISPNRWWSLTLIFSFSSRVTSMPCTSVYFLISSWERIFKFCLILWTLSPVYSLLLSFLWGAFCPREDIKFCFVQIDLFFSNYDFLKREVYKNIS